MSTDEVELARIKQRDFFLEMARRFESMADEYAPARYAENPIPIHGVCAILMVRGETGDISSKVNSMSNDLIHSLYTRDSIDSVGSGGSVRVVTIRPDLTPEQYALELSEWYQDKKAKREREAGD